MLEHVPDPAAVLHALQTLVKPDGHIVVSTLNRNLKSWLFAIVGAEYVMQLLERGTHTYSRFIRPSELATWARSAQLEVADVSGLSYDPLRGVASLSADVSVNYLMHLRRAA